MELADRLMSYVVVVDSGCYIWCGSRDADGYGRTRGRAAHRVFYELFVGPIPDGLSIDHLCRQVSCVNPRHLEAVPIRENILRGNGLAAQNAVKTHCLRGHPLSGNNLRVVTRADGRVFRNCRACKRFWRH